MRLLFLIFFITIPLIELALLIQVGQIIGVLATIGLVIATAILGAAVIQQQGFQTMQRLNETMARGEPPVGPMIDGAFRLMAGIMLLTPGVLTDAIGLLMLIPPVRMAVAKWGFRTFMTSAHVEIRSYGTRSDDHPLRPGPQSGSAGGRKPRQPAGDGPIIDGEYERMDDDKPTNHR